MHNSWIKLTDYRYNSLLVHEVQCPLCKHKETYTGDRIPRACYVCDTKLIDKEAA